MEARRLGAALIALATLLSSPVVLHGASVRSQNFIVSAPTQALAQEICEAAESQRRDLAIEWLGRELPPWTRPCPIECQIHPQLGAGGATQFSFSREGVPFGWSMSVQGSRERVLDSVLPHEITHTIFATHFGRPLPRWADEGACTTVEHTSEKKKQEKFLIDFLMTERGIPFNKMFAMKEYPPDMLPLYAQGYSLARYLIMQGGKRKYVQYVGEGMQTENWPAVTRKYYGHKDLSDLQVTWLGWVRMGSPLLEQVDGRSDVMLASNTTPAPPAAQPPSESLESNAIMAAPVTNAMPNIIPAQQPAAAAVRQGAYQQPLAEMPPRPEFNQLSRGPSPVASNQAGQPNGAGWYARQRDQLGQPGGAVSGIAPAHSLAPPPAPVPVQPISYPQGSNAPPANRRVMMEWSRSPTEPWNPPAEVAAQLEAANPANASTVAARPNEQLTRRDIATEATGGLWR
jgi:hypothetical protein